jgi:signal transduction histidine kinase
MWMLRIDTVKFAYWFADGGDSSTLWPWVTLALSALIIGAYCVIAVNWYFQAKLPSRRAQSRAALSRLRLICLCCGVCGYVFYATEMPWIVWRFYDIALAVFAISTWTFVYQTRGGIRLVDQRLAQVDELERTAARYREMAELLPHIVWTATAHGAIDFSNQRWREYVAGGGGGDAGSSAQKTWLDALHPDEQLDMLARWNSAVAARRPVTLEARLLGAAGAYRTFVIKATPLVQGEAVRWLGACADIEDQKQLAAQKEAAARQRSFFLNALSHDLRAPLHNVLLNAQLLKLFAHPDLAEAAAATPQTPAPAEADAVREQNEAVEMIIENATAAGDLLARLLDFARVGAQDANLTESVPVLPLLHQVSRRFQPMAESKGLCLRIEEAGGTPDPSTPAAAAVLADRQKLERIISNLVDNAIKYTERGEIVLHSPVTLQGGDGETRVVIRVSDTGVGIPAQNVPFLFDEFYQVNNYERDRSKGFGMGLAICKSLARNIDGEVRLGRTGPGGSCFEVLLRPAVQPVLPAVLPAGIGAAGVGAPGVSVRVEPGVGADRGGRPGGSHGDQRDPAPQGLCGV